MNKLIVAIGLSMTLAIAAVAEWPCPEGMNRQPIGFVYQYICVDTGQRCTWIPPWDYFHKYRRECLFWCCYDSQGIAMATALSGCDEEWTPNGCCASPNAGWVESPPDCPGDS